MAAMHVLYVHQNYPAQFGHIARYLVNRMKWECTFVTKAEVANVNDGVRKIIYKTAGGATERNHYCSRTFENTVWHCDGVYKALKSRLDIKPDLIVGHSGFGSTLFLRELYPKTPIVNFFEYYYHPHGVNSDMDFRHDLPWTMSDMTYLRSRCRNAMILLDMQTCDAGYTPTLFQKSRFPAEYYAKMRVIFDGVDRAVYHSYKDELRPPVARRGTRTLAGVQIGPSTRVVTYVSRGFESMRGFDQFMKTAKLIYQQFPDVKFIVVGEEKIAYGGDTQHTEGKSFKEWVLAQDQYDMEKFAFVGRLSPADLGQLLASTDLHIYLTVPFVLSWSMMDAMSCGAVVLGSATPPVMEMIQDEQNGLLADFFDPAQLAAKAVPVLMDPDAFRPLGKAAEATITDRYSMEAVLPAMLRLYEGAIGNTLRPAPSEDPMLMLPREVLTMKRPQPKSPFFG
jgi:glycosyltransferase involved in cell wall biosynthesis